jgi:hypothetical protein
MSHNWEFNTTPGSNHERCTVYVKDGPAIARHVFPEHARLIAAAPDMYEALCDIENDDGRIPVTIWDKIKAAIAKAEGVKS